MKDLKKLTLIIVGMAFMSLSCDLLEVDQVVDPNNPSTTGVLNNASEGELQDLVTGLESVHRNYMNGAGDWWSLTGTMSRELYYINTSDPTFAIQWLQLPDESRTEDAEDNNLFFADASGYESPYGAIRQSNLLIESIANTSSVTDTEKNGYLGFANTIKGYQFQVPLMHQYQQGIRVDVSFSEPLSPGGFLSYDDALQEVRNIVDEASTQLTNAGSSFNFELSDGLNEFDDPASMNQVNRAIAARLAVYAEDWQGALDALDDSFLDLSIGQGEAGLMAGPAHTFAGGDDQFNPYFFVPDASEDLIVVPSPDVINDADAGDLRIDRKFDQRTTPVTTPDIPGLSAGYQDGRFQSTDAIPFIRNEELLLIYAEAKIQLGGATNLADAVTAINIIRNTWNVGAYAGAVTQPALIDEMLKQRRFSLWGEGHRWIDMRRYDRLGNIDTSIDGGRVPTEIGRPQTEIDWDDFSGN
ncbi:MAG: RagB/SusD family nutrient uptake outer membrane protein [Balneola sp.]